MLTIRLYQSNVDGPASIIHLVLCNKRVYKYLRIESSFFNEHEETEQEKEIERECVYMYVYILYIYIIYVVLFIYVYRRINRTEKCESPTRKITSSRITPTLNPIPPSICPEMHTTVSLCDDFTVGFFFSRSN